VGLALGVVGLGRIGALHVQTLLALEHVSSVTVADVDADRARRVAAELSVDVAESAGALAASSVDALVIATATPGHVPLLKLATGAGLPAFCEKPVALDLPTLDGLRADVEAAEVFVQVGFQRRFDAGYRAARAAVLDGSLGRLLVLRAATHDPFPPAQDYIAVSGGIFADLHIHDFDAVRYVTGQEVTEVYADGAVLESEWFGRLGDVDTAAAMMRLSDGALVILSGTRHDPLGYDVRLEAFGTADSIAVGWDERSPIRSLERASPADGPAYRDFWDRFGPAYRAELAAFVDAVRAGDPSPCTLDDARAALAVALAAERSRRERRPVPLP
jgi:myo-inositol 2-dehydrogenase / D-chiro-inositol 1-dehydrogenase